MLGSRPWLCAPMLKMHPDDYQFVAFKPLNWLITNASQLGITQFSDDFTWILCYRLRYVMNQRFGQSVATAFLNAVLKVRLFLALGVPCGAFFLSPHCGHA